MVLLLGGGAGGRGALEGQHTARLMMARASRSSSVRHSTCSLDRSRKLHPSHLPLLSHIVPGLRR